jgi:hypothetical protein
MNKVMPVPKLLIHRVLSGPRAARRCINFTASRMPPRPEEAHHTGGQGLCAATAVGVLE